MLPCIAFKSAEGSSCVQDPIQTRFHKKYVV